MAPPPIEPEKLLDQAAWVRGLARSLVHDAHTADDLAQDALVVALERPVGADRPLGAWLGRVVHNLALTRSRSEKRRTLRELRAARSELVPSPADLYEHVALHRRLVEAVMDLDEPYRSTILLRYLEEQSPREIARREHIPVRTVHTRIQRGLERLRARLDREHDGNRRAWMLAWLPLTKRVGPFASGPISILIMSTQLKVAIVALALGGLMAAYLFMQRDARNPASELNARSTIPTQSSLRDEDHEKPNIAPDAPGSARAEAASNPAKDESSTPSPSVETELYGQVTASHGGPLANARVEVRRCDGRGFQALDESYALEEHSVAEVETDARGEFHLPLARATPFDVYASADGYATSKIPNRYAGEHMRVVLHKGGEIHGRITRLADGSACEDALVVIEAGLLSVEGRQKLETRTDVNGRYRMTQVPAETWSLQVRPLDDPIEFGTAIVLSEAGSVERNILIGQGATITGRVVDARTGAPIGGAWVQDGSRPALHATRTNAEGRFVLKGLYTYLGRAVNVRAKSDGLAEQERTVEISDSLEGTVDFSLELGRRVRGRVLGPDGRPLAGAYVAAVAQSATGRSIGERWFTRTGNDGSFHIEDLRADSHHGLFIRSAGCGAKLFELPDTETEKSVVDLGDFQLEKSSTLLGRIIDETGNPVPDLIVNLNGCNSDRSRLSASELPGLDRQLAHEEARTDDHGRFGFTDISSGSYSVSASIKGSATSTQTELSIRSNEVIENLVLELYVGSVIEGRLFGPDGEPVVDFGVSVYADGEALRRLTYNLTRGDGSFHLQGLQPGTYTLQVDPGLSIRLNGVAMDLPQGSWTGIQAGARDVRLELLRPASISGSVLDASGAPVAGANVQGQYCGEAPHGGFADAFAHTDAQGRFRLNVRESSCVDIEAFVADSSGQMVDQIGTIVGVAAGKTDVVLRLRKFP